MKTQAIYDCFVGARGAAAGGYAVSIGRDCLVGREDLWDSGAAAGGFQSGFRLGSESFSRGGHVCAFTYDYVKSHPEHLAPHDLSASQSEAARSECVVPEAAPAIGSSSFITDATGYAVQHLQYLPFGETFIDQQNGYDSRYTFSAKEKDDETQYSYFGARYYDSDLSVWLSVDPMSDKYPYQSPYTYVGNRPINVIDPNGMDEWEVDGDGNIINHIKTDKHDAFFIVNKNDKGEWQRVEGKEQVFSYGTVKEHNSPIVGKSEIDIFRIKGDDNAKNLFEFFAANTNVEWTHAKIGTESSGDNMVGTSHNKSSTAVGHYLRLTGYTLREVNHNHPSGFNSPSWDQTDGLENATGDVPNAKLYEEKFPKIILNTYTVANGYSQYDSHGTLDERILTNKIQ